MYRMPPLPPLVCSDVVTVLVGLIHPTDGVAIFADRASVRVGDHISDGVPAQAEPRVKVRTNGRGLIAGVAGVAQNGGVSVFDFVEQALDTSTTAVDAANTTVSLLSTNTTALLDSLAPTGPGDELAVVVLVGGHDADGTRLRMVALDWDGAIFSVPLSRSRAFTPRSVQDRADRMLGAAFQTRQTLKQQVRDLGNLLPTLAASTAVNEGIDISPEHDYVIADLPLTSYAVAVDPPAAGLNIPRH